MTSQATSLKAPIVDWDKKKTGEMDLFPEIFSKPLKKPLIHSVVLWQLAKRRQGTHKAKTKGEVRGGGSKPYRQKGTGNARRGSSRSPLIAGGGVIFPPQPKDYSYSLPKKARQTAVMSTLSYLLRENQLFILNDFQIKTGKTKDLLQKLNYFGVKKALIVSGKKNPLLRRASRNLLSFKYNELEGLNVYDLLKYKNLIVDQEGLKKLQESYLQKVSGKKSLLSTDLKKKGSQSVGVEKTISQRTRSSLEETSKKASKKASAEASEKASAEAAGRGKKRS